MIYLEATHITKTYGEKVLFEDLNFIITKGQKVGLIARNGAGKTSLFRILSGEERSEGPNAKLTISKEIRTAILKQDPVFAPGMTVLDAAMAGDTPELAAVRAYLRALQHTEDTEILEAATAQMDALKAWDVESRVHEVLFKLNLTNPDAPLESLSGGQRKRVALANILAQDADFLILDEPTNHLDIEMIEWLETYLSSPNLTLLLVTHDRYFLDNICNQILELEDGKLYKHRGGYSVYLQNKLTREQVQEAQLYRNRKLLKKELEWVRRQPKARGTKAKARVDSFKELKEKTVLRKDPVDLKISVKTERLGSKILEAHYITKRFGDKVIVEDFFYKFKKGEKVGIVGPNGVGKTTFIKLLTQQLRPDAGKVVVGLNTKFGFYDQDGLRLDTDKRVVDVVRDIADYIPMQNGRDLSAEQLLERFMFSRKQQQVYVSQLSGGERRRLYLLTVLMQNPNFLILDEPTNDLDLITLNVLEEFLLHFPGCVLVVTHDRYFMDKIVDHLFVFEGDGRIRDFNGTYAEYRSLRDREAKPNQAGTTKRPVKESGLSYEQQKRLKNLEREIERLYAQRRELEEQMYAPGLSPDELAALAAELESLAAKIGEKESEWIALQEA